MTKFHDTFPGAELWFTECSGSHGPSDPPAQVFSDTLKWHTRNLVLGVTRNWASTMVNWNLALDPSGGPHNGGCGTCTGVVTVGPGQTVTRNAEYYTLGHLARFVRPGAHRIASTSFGTTGWNGAVMDTAFRNPDGTIVLVAHNENDAPATFAVAQGGSSFDYTLPGGALATFVWPSSAAPDDGHRLLDLHGATASASEGADAGNAIDDDAVTRWTHGRRPARRADPHGRPARDPQRRPSGSRHRGAHRGRRELGPGAAVRRLPARAAGLDQHRRHDVVGAGVGDRLRPDHHRRPDRWPGPLRPARTDGQQRVLVVGRRPSPLHLPTAVTRRSSTA